METTDHAPVSSDSLCGPTMTADEPSTSAYPYDLAQSEESESDIRPFFKISTEEKRLVRKLDARILPIVCLLYLFACKSHLSPCMRVLITCRFGQDEPWQCAPARFTGGCSRRRSDRKFIRLG